MRKPQWLPDTASGYGSDSGEGLPPRLSDEYLANYTFDPNGAGANATQGVYTLKPEVAMPQDFMSRFGGAMPTGPMSLADLVKYTGGENNGFTPEKFAMLNQNTQKGILNDPATFLKGQMGYGPKSVSRFDTFKRGADYEAAKAAENPNARYTVPQGQGGSRALLDFGVEGGSRDLGQLHWDPSVGLVQDPRNYIGVNEEPDWAGQAMLLAIGAMTGGAAYPFLGAAGSGALVGGTLGAVNGFNSSPDGNFGDVLKGGAKGAASGYAGGWLGQNGGQFVKDFMPTGTSPIVNNAITGAAKGGLGSLMNGGDVGQGILKGGLSGGLKAGIGSGINASGADGGWGKLLNIGGNYLSGAATNSLFGGSKNAPSSNPYTPSNNLGTPQNNNAGGTMANGNGFDWSGLFDGVDFGKTASDLASAYQTKQQIGQTDRAYNDAKNLILNPSADQQKYRTQLAQLMDNPGSMESSPLYQSMLDQGMNAVNRTAAAKGQLGSGNRLADLMSAGQKTAANYYFPQQQALASLSGITGDSGQRALGAQSLIAGNNANVSQNRAMLSDLFSGLGVANQQQQMIDAISGRNGGQGGQGGGLINNAVGAVKNWFGGSSDWTPGDYQGFNNSIDPSMANWGDQISSWGDGSTNWFGGGGTGGASFNDMTAPINSAPSLYDFNSWKLY